MFSSDCLVIPPLSTSPPIFKENVCTCAQCPPSPVTSSLSINSFGKQTGPFGVVGGGGVGPPPYFGGILGNGGVMGVWCSCRGEVSVQHPSRTSPPPPAPGSASVGRGKREHFCLGREEGRGALPPREGGGSLRPLAGGSCGGKGRCSSHRLHCPRPVEDCMEAMAAGLWGLLGRCEGGGGGRDPWPNLTLHPPLPGDPLAWPRAPHDP